MTKHVPTLLVLTAFAGVAVGGVLNARPAQDNAQEAEAQPTLEEQLAALQPPTPEAFADTDFTSRYNEHIEHVVLADIPDANRDIVATVQPGGGLAFAFMGPSRAARNLARQQQEAATNAREAGDTEAFVEAIDALLRTGRDSAASGGMTPLLVTGAINSLAHEEIQNAARDGMLDAQTAQRLIDLMQKHAPRTERWTVPLERAVALSQLQEMRGMMGGAEDTAGSFDRQWRGVVLSLSAWKDSLAALPYENERAAETLRALQRHFANADAVTASVVETRVETSLRTIDTMRSIAAAEQLTVVALRIIADHADGLPESAADLKTDPPRDPFSERPLRYQRIDDRTFRVWSIGRDGQNHNGRMPEDPSNAALRAEAEIHNGWDYAVTVRLADED